MNITKENATNSVLELKINIEAADYQANMDKILKDYQRKANIPGFRAGKVPFSLIQKQYGKAVLAEEVNKVLSEAINKYVEDNKLSIIGNALPIDDKNQDIDFENATDFTFWFEIALTPEFEVKMDKLKVKMFDISVDEKLIDESVENMRKRFGNVTNPEAPAEEQNIDLAELNEELFNQVYPKDNIKTEKELRERIAKEGKEMYGREADRKFLNDVVEELVEKTKFEIPEEFLKRWIQYSSQDQQLTREQVEANFPYYLNSFKWQLIEQKIVEANDLKVTRDDVRKYYKDNVVSLYFPPSENEEQEKRMDMLVDSMLQNQKEVKQIYDMLYDQKLTQLFKDQVKQDVKKVTFDEFVEDVKKANEKATKNAKKDE